MTDNLDHNKKFKQNIRLFNSLGYSLTKSIFLAHQIMKSDIGAELNKRYEYNQSLKQRNNS